MKFAERMQTYAAAVVPAPDRCERRMKYLALYLLETHMENLVDGEAHMRDNDDPYEFRGKTISVPEHGVRFCFLNDGKICVEIDS